MESKGQEQEEQKAVQQPKPSTELSQLRKAQILAISEVECQNIHSDQGQLEDVTDLVFSAVELLKDCEMMSKPDFDMNETMSAFEVMDKKMDVRMARKEALLPKQAIEKGILIVDRPLNNQELVALLDQFVVQIASWQKYNGQLQQSIYNCQYLISREYYSKNPLLINYFDTLHYFLFTFFNNAKMSIVIREEDVVLPPFIKPQHQGDIWQILEKLSIQIEELAAMKNDAEATIIEGHLRLMKALAMLLLYYFDSEALAIMNKSEEEGAASKKKRKSKKKAVDIEEIVKNFEQALQKIKKSITGPYEKQRAWATELFNDSILASLPFVQSRRNFNKLSLEESHSFLENFLFEIKNLVEIGPKIEYYEDMQLFMDKFVVKSPCSMLKVIYERAIFSENPQSLTIFGIQIKNFMEKGIKEQHPFIEKYFELPTFNEFLHKYSIVTKEMLINGLRSKARQRRVMQRLFEDFAIVLNEGNFADEKILSTLNQNVKQNNTVGIALTINMSVQCQINYLQKGFELELYNLHELPMIYNYISYSYQMMFNNRKTMMTNLCDSLIKSNLVDFNNLNNSGAKFKQFRKRMTPLKKIVVDHYDFCRGMMMIYRGMQHFVTGCLNIGAIDNVFAQEENLERHVYDNRFKAFRAMYYPRYIPYEQYSEDVHRNQTLQAEMEQAKYLLNEGKNILNNLNSTEEALRNLEHLNKEYLEKLIRLTVMNSLMTTKLLMLKEKAVAKVNKDNSLKDLLAFDVDSRP